MKTRSSFEICLPLVLCIAACLASTPTRIICLVWLTLGAISIGHRPFAQLPTDGISRKWLRGPRRVCLRIYHLAWWPWYMRAELAGIEVRMQVIVRSGCRWIGGRRTRGASARRMNDDEH